MTSKTISELDSVTTLGTSDLLPVTQGSTGPGTGVTRKATMAEVQALLPTPTSTIGALVCMVSNQSIPNTAQTTLTWATIVYDTGGFFNVSDPTKFTVPSGVSKVRVTASALWPASTGYKEIQTQKNGTNYTGKAFEQLAAVPGLTTSRALSALVEVNAGDYFTVSAYQDSGGAVSVQADTATWFMIEVPQGLAGPQGEQGPGVPSGGTTGQVLVNATPGEGAWFDTQGFVLTTAFDDVSRTIPAISSDTFVRTAGFYAAGDGITYGGYFEPAALLSVGSGAYTLDLSGALAPEDVSASYYLSGTGTSALVVKLPDTTVLEYGQHIEITTDKTWSAVTFVTAGADVVNNAPSALYPGNSLKLRSDSLIWTPMTGSGLPGVTSVAQSFTGGLISVGGSPITTAGTLALTVAGTSGGIPYFSGASTWASSGALTAYALIVGGGAGAAPAPLGSLGTSTTVLHGNVAGAPTFGPVSLTADVSGTLPVANGGTGITNVAYVSLNFLMNSNGVAITTGKKDWIEIDSAFTVAGWTITLADAAGATVTDSITVDVLCDVYASYGTGTSMVGAGTKPSVSSATKNQASPSGWTTTSIAANSLLCFQVTSAPTTATRCTITLKLQRT